MMKRVAWVFAFVFLSSPPLVWAQQNLSAQQAAAQKQRAELQQRINTLQKSIESTKTDKKDATVALRDIETRISQADRELLTLQQRHKDVEQHLAELKRQIVVQEKKQDEGQALLAEQLRAQYATGLSPWTALLSGKDPQQIQRELGYLGYVSTAHASQVRELQQGLARLQQLQHAVTQNQAELTQLSAASEVQKQQLQKQQTEREDIVRSVSAQLQQQQDQASRLTQNDEQLSRLITGLEQEIARQAELRRLAEQRRKAEEAQRLAEEKRRQEQEARRLAEQKRLEQARLAEAQAKAKELKDQQQALLQQDEAKLAQLRQEQLVRDKELADQRAAEERRWYALAHTPAQAQAEPAPAPATVVIKAPAVAPVEAPSGGFTGLKRGLPPPVRGEVLGRFGAERPEGGPWRGIILRAPVGTSVKSVSAGRVVFSNWMAGFGNLLIVDHGAGFLSVYGHNQSVLKQVGDVVNSGDVVARVGATGGQTDPGVYFEIRQNGKPVNPQLWLGN